VPKGYRSVDITIGNCLKILYPYILSGGLMKIVFEISKEKFKDAKKILEENPYAEDSFAKAGYVLKEGKALGEDENYYIYLDAGEDFVKKAKEKLKDVAKAVEGEKAERIIKKVEDEQNSAVSGFGSLFG